jgi:hypothetical protein
MRPWRNPLWLKGFRQSDLVTRPAALSLTRNQPVSRSQPGAVGVKCPLPMSSVGFAKTTPNSGSRSSRAAEDRHRLEGGQRGRAPD